MTKNSRLAVSALSLKFLKLLNVFIFCFLADSVVARDLINQDIVNQFKQYLGNITSIAVDFTQEEFSQKNIISGKLLINKPHKFRCNYYEPFPLLVIGNKSGISIYDYEMENVSHIRINENIFNFLLDDNLNFDKYFTITKTLDYVDEFIIAITHNISERTTNIHFDKKLKQIRSVEILEDNKIININFNHIVKIKQFDNDLFILKNIEIFGTPKRLNKREIESKYLHL